MDDLIRAAGFDMLRLRTEYAPGPRPMTYMYVGWAQLAAFKIGRHQNPVRL